MEERDPIVNAGVSPWSACSALFDHRRAFAATRFFHGDPLDLSFGGAWAAQRGHSGAAQNAGLLESTPHVQINVMIGGRVEDAASAMNDPAQHGRFAVSFCPSSSAVRPSSSGRGHPSTECG